MYFPIFCFLYIFTHVPYICIPCPVCSHILFFWEVGIARSRVVFVKIQRRAKAPNNPVEEQKGDKDRLPHFRVGGSSSELAVRRSRMRVGINSPRRGESLRPGEDTQQYQTPIDTKGSADTSTHLSLLLHTWIACCNSEFKLIDKAFIVVFKTGEMSGGVMLPLSFVRDYKTASTFLCLPCALCVHWEAVHIRHVFVAREKPPAARSFSPKHLDLSRRPFFMFEGLPQSYAPDPPFPHSARVIVTWTVGDCVATCVSSCDNLSWQLARGQIAMVLGCIIAMITGCNIQCLV